jgi:mono/diheme cytochrome c family protein
MRKILLLLSLGLPLHAADPLITYENRPMGSAAKPLVLRSYLPDPDIDDAVFSQHDTGRKVAKYNPDIGADVKGEVQPIPGLAAPVGVNFGPALSYVFDTTEARLLYAWQGGFVDMTPYWGDVEKGSRISMGYVPKLVGTLFWKAAGKDPIELDGKSISDLGPRVYTGHRLVKGVPAFEFKAGGTPFTLTVTPSEKPLACEVTVTTPADGTLSWRGIDGASGKGALKVTLAGSELAKFQGYQPDNKISKASASAGEKLFTQYGCTACHSVDGSKSHGPSVGGLFGHEVEIEGLDQPVKADRAYLLESIKEPNAKVVKGYPPNYMPPFGLPDVEYDSLALYIESLAKPE